MYHSRSENFNVELFFLILECCELSPFFVWMRFETLKFKNKFVEDKSIKIKKIKTHLVLKIYE